MFGSCLVIFILSVLCEALHFVRHGLIDVSLELEADKQSLIVNARTYGATGSTTGSSVTLTGYTEFAMQPLEDEDYKQTNTRSAN